MLSGRLKDLGAGRWWPAVGHPMIWMNGIPVLVT